MCVPPIPQATIYLKNCFPLCIDDGHLPSRPFLKGALRLRAFHLANLCNGMCPRGCNAMQLDIGFYNQHGTAEHWIKEGKKAVTRPPESRPAQSIIEKAPEHP